MTWERIRKGPEDRSCLNLSDLEEYAKTFSWSGARALLDGLPSGGLNIAYTAKPFSSNIRCLWLTR